MVGTVVGREITVGAVVVVRSIEVDSVAQRDVEDEVSIETNALDGSITLETDSLVGTDTLEPDILDETNVTAGEVEVQDVAGKAETDEAVLSVRCRLCCIQTAPPDLGLVETSAALRFKECMRDRTAPWRDKRRRNFEDRPAGIRRATAWTARTSWVFLMWFSTFLNNRSLIPSFVVCNDSLFSTASAWEAATATNTCRVEMRATSYWMSRVKLISDGKHRERY